jgi:hypothetical protein
MGHTVHVCEEEAVFGSREFANRLLRLIKFIIRHEISNWKYMI